MAEKFYVKTNPFSWAEIKNFYVKTNPFSWAAIANAWVKVSPFLWKSFWSGLMNPSQRVELDYQYGGYIS